MIDLDILLNPDEEGNPENTTRRTPESNYNLDNKDIVRKISQVEEVLDSARDALIYFVTSLPAPEQVFMIQQATIPWLKDLDVIKAYVAEKPIVNAGDKGKEDDMTTITPGEDNTADIKIPKQEEIVNLNQGGVNAAPKPTHSPSSSGESIKSLQTEEESFQNQEALPKLSGRILGNLDDTMKDTGVSPIINYAKKAKSVKVNPDLTLQDVKSSIKKDTLSVKDPGVWDTPASSKLIKECSAEFMEGAGQDSSWFLLSTPSSLAVKKPRLVGF